MGISAGVGNTGTVPVGVVNPFAGSVAPAGWLLCAGQAVSRTEYSGLFLTIGTTYGVGNGSTTFNLPDMRGRVVAGVDNMGGTAASRLTSTVLSASNTIGAVGGSETHTLTSAQSGIPAHGHSTTVGNDSPDHSHSGSMPATSYNAAGNLTVFTTPQGLTWYHSFTTGGASARHSHSVTVNNNTAANASQAHTNTQPTIVLNYIIKAA